MAKATGVFSTQRARSPVKRRKLRPYQRAWSLRKKYIRARLALIAAERHIPKAAMAKAMTCRDQHLIDFVLQHRISIDWLILGDLRGLLQTVREHRQ